MQVGIGDVFISVIGLFLFMIPGFIIIKTKLDTIAIAKSLSRIILYVCTTAFMFLGFQKCTFDTRIGINILITFGIASLVHIIMIGLVMLFFKKETIGNKCIKISSVFSNCGYMGIPFLNLVFGKSEQYGEILVYASIVIMVFYFFALTVGVIFAGDKKDVSFKKIATNPIIIAIILSLIIFVTVKVPFKELPIENDFLKRLVDQTISVIESIGSTVTPLSMMLIGMQLGAAPLKSLFTDPRSYIIALFKLVIMPLISILLVVFLPIDICIKYVVFFLLSMPTATISAMLIIHKDGDAELASKSILLSNILSVATIPLMFLLFDWLVKLF